MITRNVKKVLVTHTHTHTHTYLVNLPYLTLASPELPLTLRRCSCRSPTCAECRQFEFRVRLIVLLER